MPADRATTPSDTPTSKRMKDLAGASANALSHEAHGEHMTHPGTRYRTSQTEVERIIGDWPDAPKTGAQNMLERYGLPNEATPTRLTWYQTGPWKWIQVTRNVQTHHFPMPHSDYLWNAIDYKVPLDKVRDIIEFDGSTIIDRTAGEVAAHCDSEWANILTLNLVHDIVTGSKNVQQARQFFGEQSAAYALGRPAPYAERLQFQPPKGGTAEVDEAVIAKPMMEQMMEKMKDLVTGRQPR